MLLTTLFQQPLIFLIFVLVFLITLSIHECSHALMAYWLGDLTAKRAGRLTLNPMAHVDLLGFLTLILIGFGWGKPVPFNPYNVKYNKWGPVLVAAAGPISNFLLGFVFTLAYRGFSFLGDANLLVIFLQLGAYLSFLLGFFNLIPIPPLDGSKALLALIQHERYRKIRMFLETRGSVLLLILIFLDSFGGIGVFSFISQLSSALFTALVHLF